MQAGSSSSQDVAALMDSLGRAAVAAAQALARASTATKNAALAASADEIRASKPTAEFEERVGGPPNFIGQFVDGLITELSAQRR